MDFNLTFAQTVFAAIVGLLFYFLALVVYRLLLSPLKNFPGPRLAAATLWYEFYYDAIAGGQYEFRIAELHKQYGPIVRIGPSEVHIDDPDFYEILNNGGVLNGKRVKIDRWDYESAKFGSARSAFATAGHDLHRNRRAVVAPSFSARAVATLTPLVENYANRLVEKLTEIRGTGRAVDLFAVYAGLTADIISAYSFGKPLGLLEKEEYGGIWRKLLHDMGQVAHWMKQFRWIGPTLQALPENIAEMMNPQLVELGRLQRLIKTQIAIVGEEMKAGDVKNAPETSRQNIFHAILSSDLPASEKTLDRLMDEGTILMTAGTVTTADSLTKISYFLLSEPEKLEKLRQELKSVPKANFDGDSQKWLQQIEKLPYATAVIKEGLRLTGGVLHRLHRILPDTDLRYGDRIIPRGTPIAMSIWNVHKNPEIYPDPESFRPERWLQQDSNSDFKLEKYLVPFSKGTRQCIAQNLAWAEMYLVLATVFDPERLHLELFETTHADIEGVRDNFMEGYSSKSKGVRVRSV